MVPCASSKSMMASGCGLKLMRHMEGVESAHHIMQSHCSESTQ